MKSEYDRRVDERLELRASLEPLQNTEIVLIIIAKALLHLADVIDDRCEQYNDGSDAIAVGCFIREKAE